MSEKVNCVKCGNDAPYACGNCGSFYCSLSCQKVDWHHHRSICFRTPNLVPFAELDYASQQMSRALRNNYTKEDNLTFDKNDRNGQYISANENQKRSDNSFQQQQEQEICLPYEGNKHDKKKSNHYSGNIGNYGKNGPQITNNVGKDQHNANIAQENYKKKSKQDRNNVQSRRSSDYPKNRQYGDQQYCSQQDRIQVVVQKVNPDSKEKMCGVRFCDEDHQQQRSENQKRNQQKYNDNEQINNDDLAQTQEVSFDKKQLKSQSNRTELKYQNDEQNFNARVLNPPFEIIKFTENHTNFEAVIIDKSCIGDGMFACIPNFYFESFMEMQSFLAQIKKDGPPYKPVLHEYCIALFEGEWYRAKVIAVKETEIQVEYIDFCNEDCVKLNNIRQYPLELKAVCSTNFCKLAGLPKVLHPQLLNYLEKIIDEFQKVYVTRVIMSDNICEIECPVLLKELKEFGFI
ncbi:uncharacterized protein LOC119662734 [Teleopsis dalmanni]|uniref:uncharacterized protein LOC119662672 n=1 Tax=Teleopsis dalmanni TaxID=139649 RepID=UPI0018CEA7C0|nr:uncharacterized protein LOC119662672 [Teleopsis dalmanni]XP_037928281.1 uncharacterized protein LOC119662672 [Teleopsis dalmanni]XP_037928399.1 uncharacterized protein LOC119662734 [Teleopsis dalmanni]